MAEIVIVLPAALLAVLLFAQVAMWGLSAHALSAAVAEAGASGRAQYDGPGAVASATRREISLLAGSLVPDPVVTVRVLPGQYLEIIARASVPAVFPGLRPTVSASSIGPIQLFRASG